MCESFSGTVKHRLCPFSPWMTRAIPLLHQVTFPPLAEGLLNLNNSCIMWKVVSPANVCSCQRRYRSNFSNIFKCSHLKCPLYPVCTENGGICVTCASTVRYILLRYNWSLPRSCTDWCKKCALAMVLNNIGEGDG